MRYGVFTQHERRKKITRTNVQRTNVQRTTTTHPDQKIDKYEHHEYHNQRLFSTPLNIIMSKVCDSTFVSEQEPELFMKYCMPHE